jgi:NAD(P)-dependent dehydrogenase (short-subunit alcohol dehydrogenase family)
MSTPVPATAGFRANVLEEELGALRRNAFKSPANDAVPLSTEQLLADGAKLKDKVVLITGSGSLEGFGGRLALKAAGYGAKVVVSDLKAEGVEKVVQKIKETGGCVVIFLFLLFLGPSFPLPSSASGADLSLEQNCDRHRLRRHRLEPATGSLRPFLLSPASPASQSSLISTNSQNYAISTFGSVEVVVANAGVLDYPPFLLDEVLNETGELEVRFLFLLLPAHQASRN